MLNSPYRTSSDDYPNISTQELDGVEFKVMMISDRSTSWYGNAISGSHEYLNLIEPGHVIYDCGANEGYTSIIAAIKAGESGKVLAFEAGRHNEWPFRINVALNCLEGRIELMTCAVGRSSGKIRFKGEQASADGDEVDCVAIDDIDRSLPDLIKIDVEGMEYDVLLGASSVIRRARPIIFLEPHLSEDGSGVDMRNHGATPEKLAELLDDLGYEWWNNGCRMDKIVIQPAAMILRHRSMRTIEWCGFKKLGVDRVSKVPPCLCITTPSSTERRNTAEEHFRSIGIDVQFVNGFEGRSLNLRPVEWSGEIKSGQPYYSSVGQVGCTLSHMMAWSVVEHLGHGEAIIFEDDVILPPDFKDRFGRFYRMLPEDWQFEFVGSYDQSVDAVRVNDMITIDEPYRTHAYMIKASAIPVLRSTVNSAKHHIDVLIRRFALPHLKHYCFSPPIAAQRTAEGQWKSITS